MNVSGINFKLRPAQVGEYSWIVHRQALLYKNEYNWNEEFEGLACEIVADFIKSRDPEREECFVVIDANESQKSKIYGAVFVVKESKTVAKLRLLHVEQEARGKGLGHLLVRQALTFAEERAYKSITLWTNSVLTTARKVYEHAGFYLVKSEAHHSFGHDLIGQHWQKDFR